MRITHPAVRGDAMHQFIDMCLILFLLQINVYIHISMFNSDPKCCFSTSAYQSRGKIKNSFQVFLKKTVWKLLCGSHKVSKDKSLKGWTVWPSYCSCKTVTMSASTVDSPQYDLWFLRSKVYTVCQTDPLDFTRQFCCVSPPEFLPIFVLLQRRSVVCYTVPPLFSFFM